jgi:hypothetical protein
LTQVTLTLDCLLSLEELILFFINFAISLSLTFQQPISIGSEAI